MILTNEINQRKKKSTLAQATCPASDLLGLTQGPAIDVSKSSQFTLMFSAVENHHSEKESAS